MLIGLLADLISANRRLMEDTLYRVKQLDLDRSQPEGAAIPDNQDAAWKDAGSTIGRHRTVHVPLKAGRSDSDLQRR